MAAANPPSVEVRKQPSGGYVAVDTETGTRVEAKSKFFAPLALMMKVKGQEEWSEQFASMETFEEFISMLTEQQELMAGMEKFMQTVQERRAEIKQQEEKPDPSSIRGIMKGSTDKSASELIAESRAKEEEREQRLVDAT